MDQKTRDAIAKVTVTRPDGAGRGTAFLITKDLVATALHTVADRREEIPAPYGPIVLEFPGHTTQAELVGYDREADCAVLRCVNPPRTAPLQMRGLGRSGDPWQTWGYPNLQSLNGLALDGEVTTTHGELYGEKNIIQLFCNQLAAGLGADARGLSGSPVLANDRVVGIMRFALGPDERVAGGVLYACPIWKLHGVAGLVVEVAPVVGPGNTDDDLAAVIGSNARPYARKVKEFVEITRGPVDCPAPYARRNTTLRELQTWYQSSAVPRFLMIGPAGRGKSAVLVEWLLELSKAKAGAQTQTHIVFVPISLRVGTYMPVVFFQMLASRLAAIVGREVKNEQFDAAIYYEGLCGQLCDELIANQADVLIVVDGVDEALEGSFRADWFSGRSESSVKLVLSARETLDKGGGQFWLNKFGWQANRNVVVHQLPLLEHAAVRELVSGLPAIGSSAELVEQIAARLSALTKGEPLLLRFYAEDLLEQAPFQTDVLEFLQDAAPGLSGYFDHWWSLQRTAWRDEGVSPDVEKLNAHLGALACAFGALGADDLGRIVEIAHGHKPASDMKETLWPLRRFVLGDGQSPAKGGRGYVMAHPGLRDFFLERFSGAFVERIREAFVEWASGIAADLNSGNLAPSKASTYAVSFLTQHLDEIGAPPTEYFRLFDLGWVQAWEHAEGSLRGLSLDIERAERAAMRSPGGMAYSYRLRARLLLCSIRNTSRVPPELLIAALDQQLLGWREVEGRLGLLVGFAKVRGLGDLSRRMPDDERDRVLGIALEAADLLSDPQDRAMALAAVASHLPETDAETVELRSLEAAGQIRMLSFWYDAMRWIIPKFRHQALFGLYRVLQLAEEKTENWEYFIELLPRVPESVRVDALDLARRRLDGPATGESSGYRQSADDISIYPRILLSPYFGVASAEQLRTFLTAARSFDRAAMTALALSALLPFLAEDGREELIDEIVDTASSTTSKLFLLECIGLALPYAQGTQKETLIKRGWQICSDETFDHDYLLAILPYVTEAMRLQAFNALLIADKEWRSKSFELLAASLSVEQIQSALLALRANRDGGMASATLLVLAGYLDLEDGARDRLEARVLPELSSDENIHLLCSAIGVSKAVSPQTQACVAGSRLLLRVSDRIEQSVNANLVQCLPPPILRDLFDRISSQDARDPYYFRPRALAAIIQHMDEGECGARVNVAFEEPDDWIRALLSSAFAKRLSGAQQAAAIQTALEAMASAPLPYSGREAALAVEAFGQLIQASSAPEVCTLVDAKIAELVRQRPIPWASAFAPVIDRLTGEDRQALWSETECQLLGEEHPSIWPNRYIDALQLASPSEQARILAACFGTFTDLTDNPDHFLFVSEVVGELPDQYDSVVIEQFLANCDKPRRDQLFRGLQSLAPVLARLEGPSGIQNLADGIEVARRCFP
ncbi:MULTISPECIES: trypsin-like serine peptidase [unclassified Ensifer]|uniref:trypsin-like serine peptidase n=1 Tax=unclassified Ensifer TaxID=2633371 RepID=UPI000716203F|nr:MULTISPECIES: serine protease [unclassified Ensifer]KQX52448.1 hypothetical protein ASD49_29555 [Ensifer sp. Root1298]KQX85600.1 hypothetical protein ASD41_29420 [Ensifer sp. Root1312]KRC21485.1 hypothetical protein ASE29_30235 [Ensifer sp. Root74]KRD60850.1 hypothetical protein ASE71_33040 [Ensifer sp. Root954]